MTLTFGSLFAGIGGFDLGFERAGMSCAWRSEIDKGCNALVEKRRPHIKNLGDVRNVTKRRAGTADVVCGGFPCQDLSVAGKRKGLAGERSGLWFEFHRVIEECRPRWVVVENVPGLLSSQEGGDFTVVLRGLDELGYCVAGRVLDAQYFGVPQRRRRVFLVASLGNTSSVQVLFEPESMQGNFEAGGEEREDATAYSLSGFGGYSESVGSLRANGGDYGGGSENLIAKPLLGKQGRRDNGGDENLLVTDARGNGDGMVANDRVGDHQDRVTDYTALVSFAWQQGSPKNGMGREYIARKGDYAGSLSASRHDAIAFSADRDGADDTTELSPTLRHGGDEPDHHKAFRKMAVAWHENKGGSFTEAETARALRAGASHSYQGTGVRRLTPTECERLQGFPDGWTGGFADSVRYKMLGNAVAVPCAEWIGRRIVEIEKGKA